MRKQEVMNKTWFGPEQIKDNLLITEKGITLSKMTLRRKIRISMLHIASCLWNTQDMKLSADVWAGHLNLGSST